MRKSVRLSLPLAVAAAAALTLSACGGSTDADSASSAPAPAPTSASASPDDSAVSPSPIGGGEAVCDQATLATAVAETAAANGVTAEPMNPDFTCADGWAVAFAPVVEGEVAQVQSFVFQAEGAFWVPQDAVAVCDGDVEGVPAAIAESACLLK